MSTTSRVKADLQKEILEYAAKRPNATNQNIYWMTGQPSPLNSAIMNSSLRKIQEATQKLTKAGILASPKRGTYVLASTPVASAATV